MKALFVIAISVLFMSNSFSSEIAKAIESMSSKDKEEIKKMSKEQRQQMTMMLLMMMEMEGEMEKRIYQKSILPEKIISGKEGFKFKTKIPFFAERRVHSGFARYKVNESIKSIDLTANPFSLNCGGCFATTKFPPGRFVYGFYPIGAEFQIEEFIGVPGEITTIVNDSKGRRILISDHDLKQIVDGVNYSFQNEEKLLLDTLVVNKERVEMQVQIRSSELEQFQEGIIKNETKYWDFPPVDPKVDPKLDSKDYQGWLYFAAKNFLTKEPSELVIKNIRKVEHYTILDMSADMETFSILIYSRLISPYFKILDYQKFNDSYDSRWKNQTTYVLGEKSEDFIKKLQAMVKKPVPQTEEEKKKAKEEYLKELKEKRKNQD